MQPFPNHALVSVIIPTYNSAHFIKDTFTSVVNQTHHNIEIIFVDDGSTDNTVDILEKLSKSDPRVQLYCQKHRGVSCARNFAISKSNGDFIALLDHDDLWLPDKLVRQLHLFLNPEVGVVYSNAIFWRDGKKNLGHSFSKNRPHRGNVHHHLLNNNFITCSSVIIRKSVLYKETFFFDPMLEMCEDYDLFIRLSLVTHFDYTNESLVKWRIHNNNSTFKNMELFYPEYMIIQKKLKGTTSKSLEAFKAQTEYFHAFLYWKEKIRLKAFALFFLSSQTKIQRLALAMMSLFLSYPLYQKLRYKN